MRLLSSALVTIVVSARTGMAALAAPSPAAPTYLAEMNNRFEKHVKTAAPHASTAPAL